MGQDQAVAQAGAQDAPSAESLDIPFLRTEGPRETFVSFLRLKDELETRVSSYLQDHRRTEFERLTTAKHVAEELFDLSAVPEAARDKVAVSTLISMLDIFDRIDVPQPESVPLAEDLDQSNAAVGWRIPHTPLRIGRVDAGDRQGEFLFTPRTVAIAPRFSRQVSLPTIEFPR